MKSKLEYTQELYERITEAVRPPNVNIALFHWWRNPNQKSMRLSDAGFGVFCQHCESKPYEVLSRWDASSDLKVLLQLDKKIPSPYWTEKDRIARRIVFFGSDVAMWYSLYGDLTKFLENYRA